MSRSQPTQNDPNPSTRWFEWNGEHGTIRYYDKTSKTNVDVPAPFQFMLLDRLGGVTGWHDASSSGIYSNEVRDTRQDVLIVKAFKGGTLAEGLYKDIKDRVNTVGGKFAANCYLAYKNGDGLGIGAIRFSGASLRAWMDFEKAHRQALYKQAIVITGYTEGQKGRVTFRVPTFSTKDVSEESHHAALALDQELQTFLTGYLARTKREQAEVASEPSRAHEEPPDEDPYADVQHAPYDDEIPF